MAQAHVPTIHLADRRDLLWLRTDLRKVFLRTLDLEAWEDLQGRAVEDALLRTCDQVLPVLDLDPDPDRTELILALRARGRLLHTESLYRSGQLV